MSKSKLPAKSKRLIKSSKLPENTILLSRNSPTIAWRFGDEGKQKKRNGGKDKKGKRKTRSMKEILSSKRDASSYNNDEFAIQASSCPPLIPGLPEDLARNCLARVPWIRLATQVTVCKRWASYIRSDDFFRFRSHLQLSTENLLVVVSVAYDTSFSRWNGYHRLLVSVYDPKVWHKPLAVLVQPFDWEACLTDFRCAIIGTDLFIIGGDHHDCNVGKKGWHPGYACDNPSLGFDKWTTRNNVWRFNFVSTSWTSAAPMHFARRDFACAVVDGKKIFVAGGATHASPDISGLYSAEMYDYKQDRWDVLPNLHESRTKCLGAALEGRFYVIGGSYFSEVFDIEKGQWYAINNIWQGRNVPAEFVIYLPLALASFDESLYALVPALDDSDDPSQTMLKIYDENFNQWNDVMPLKTKGLERSVYSRGDELFCLSGQGLFWMMNTGASHPRRLKVSKWVSSANVEIHHPSTTSGGIYSSQVVGSGVVCI